jgi:ethanolamine transporter EutH
VIQRFTIRRPLDPIAALVEDLYHAAPGDLAMFMGAIQRHDYPGALALARDLWAPLYAETILGPMMVRPGISLTTAVALMTYLRNEVVHPK